MPRFAVKAKRPVWVAAQVENEDGPLTYGRPTRYLWNWRSLNSSVDIAAFGPSYIDYRRAVAPTTEVNGVKRLDRVWLEREPTTFDDPLASDADFYVYGIAEGVLGVSEVTFKRLSPDGD